MSSTFARAKWRKSSHSATGNDTCVEVAALQAAVGVRDSTDPEGPAFAFSREAWKSFAERITSGELDL